MTCAHYISKVYTLPMCTFCMSILPLLALYMYIILYMYPAYDITKDMYIGFAYIVGFFHQFMILCILFDQCMAVSRQTH